MINYFPLSFAKQAFVAFIISLIICSLLYIKSILPLHWIILAIVEAGGFFLFLHITSKSWSKISSKQFTKRLFHTSLIIRVIWVISSYFFYIHMTGDPFEFDASDSKMYHFAASTLANLGFDNLSNVFWGLGISDRGFPFYLSTVYYLFGDYVIIPRLLNALLGSWTVIIIYRLARRNFGEPTGRLAGIIMMLMPSLIYYCGIHLKETLMVFLLTAFMDRADMLFRKKIRVFDIIIAMGLVTVLYFFRTVLLACAIFALFSMLLFMRKAGSNILQRIILGLWIISVGWITFSYRIKAEIDYYLENIDVQSKNMDFRAKREGGNRLSKYGSTAIFAPLMLIAPFPTLVNIETQQIHMMMSGGYFVKNIIGFFVLISIVIFIRKRQLRKYVLILSFILAYLAILARSQYALSERFHYPALPFLIILAAYGITQINHKSHKYYIPYLSLIVIIVIAWNVFKLAGRGGV